ncbi:uncharacterized protein BX663DRAFT_513323 [Cokeromyces recurvatus]|uniref:uncharacterized protein n=1 Tax=Cokeromyces recurvatus TaxID=90255 RepID=UPI00221FDEA9|nr:uncharacterized protein BX663DRAFT_513323 [Cokeromyces recurvatus]KAI7901571.1 hypothetical protein BX663DRAFT_513323 [Cokeromyces recurvatus]
MSTTVATAATAAAAATTTATITPSIISNDTKTSNWYFKLPPNDKRKLSSSSANTNTSSPPHTTPSPPTYYPSIPEEEDEDMDNQQRNSLMLQGANDIAIIKPLIQTYLTHFEGERKITILTSRVAQKSYGTEKRFLCPPPYTILSGASWFTTSKPPNIVVHITGEKTSQNSVIEWRQHNNTLMDSTLSTLLNDSTKMNNITGNCVSRNLHINDADEKRKRVEVLVKITLGNGSLLGTLPSKSIKVISKPSKKRQSVKNMELCIHHGSAVALFNRIRSQTVSTKYLGVSSTENDASTCFVARTNSWDPFIVWIVDTTRSPDSIQPPLVHHPDDPQFPAPPAIAIQYTKSQQQQQPIALHYNQPIVLQCVTTGLVSPVMVIRRVDKGSWVVGGNRLDDLSVETGGECGDEALGDPVSQLHKVAFQIVHDPSIAHHNKSQSNPLFNSPTEWTLPQATQSATYLACLDNVVGMHRTTSERRVIVPRPNPPPPPTMDALWPQEMVVDNHEGGGKMIRKRRVSCDVTGKSTSTLLKGRRRVNSLTIDNNNNNGKEMGAGRRMSSDRRSSLTGADSYTFNGSCWTEDVSDAAVWTIVGTDYVQYKFWTPPPMISDLNSPFSVTTTRSPITPFPIISTIQTNQEVSGITQLMLHGQGFTRDISVWFGDIKSSHTDYKSREFISCLVPDIQDMLNSKTKIKVEDESQSSPIMYQIPLLFVRSDGIVYNTDRFYIF